MGISRYNKRTAKKLTGKASFLLSFPTAYLLCANVLFPRNFYKNSAALFILLSYYLIVRYSSVCCYHLHFLLSYDFCLVILIPIGLTPNNKIDSFLHPVFSRRLFHMFDLSLSLSLYCRRWLSLFHFTGARFPEISSTYYTTIHHLRYLLPSPPPFLSRLLTAVCQPSTPPYFSRVLARSSSGRRW